jgi:hypothetical protein
VAGHEFVKRLWRTIKYDLRACDSVSGVHQPIGRYLDLDAGHLRAVNGGTPDQAYFGNDTTPPIRLAA